MLLTSSLFLSACDEGGFSSTKTNNNSQTNTSIVDENDGKIIEEGGGGASGSSGEHNDNDNNNNENNNTSTSITDDNNNNNSQADIGTLITNFRATSIHLNENSYANISFDKNPFSEEYQFSYYTVNEVRLEQADIIVNDDNNSYNIYIGSTNGGTYLIKYFNNELKQYGSTELKVKGLNSSNNFSYLSMSFNLLQVRFCAIGYTIQMKLQKIGEFFKNIFGNDHIQI